MPARRLTRRAALLVAGGVAALAGRGGAQAQQVVGGGSVRRWRHYLDTPHGQVHAFSAAPTRLRADAPPPLLCFHPSPTTGDMYRDLQAQLATDRVVHCLDTPGFGGSDPPARKPTMQDYGAALAAALDVLVRTAQPRRARTIDLFGFHTGSLCAIEVALQRSRLVRRVVLSGVPHYDAAERERQRRQNVRPYPYFSEPDYVARMYERLVLDARDSGTPEQRLTRFGDRLRAGSNGWWGPDAVFTYDSPAALPRLSQPTLLIAFDEEMTEPTRQAARLIPNARLVEMLDLPIFGFIVDPARVAAEIPKLPRLTTATIEPGKPSVPRVLTRTSPPPSTRPT